MNFTIYRRDMQLEKNDRLMSTPLATLETLGGKIITFICSNKEIAGLNKKKKNIISLVPRLPLKSEGEPGIFSHVIACDLDAVDRNAPAFAYCHSTAARHGSGFIQRQRSASSAVSSACSVPAPGKRGPTGGNKQASQSRRASCRRSVASSSIGNQ